MNQPIYYVFIKSEIGRKRHVLYVNKGNTPHEVASCSWDDKTEKMKLENNCLRLQNVMMEYAMQVIG